MNYCMVEIAFDSEEEVSKATNELLQKRLISSSQIVKSSSKWRWNGELEMSDEFLMLIKTKKEHLDEIYKIVRNIHSYDCFEFAVFDMTSINKDYLEWIDRETK